MNNPAIEANSVDHGGETADWPLRPWLLAGLLGLAGLLIWAVTKDNEDDPLRMAGAAFLFFGPLAAAFSFEREKWKEVAAFALVAGLVMAGLAWRAVSAGDRFADEEYGFAAGVFATVIALPLFQSGFHRTRFATPYRTIHFHVWTDAVSAAGSMAFVGLTWLMTLLLASLFQLLKIDFLMDLLDKGWFGWTLSGAAFGAALGVLRNKIGILGTLQHVVMLVLSLLAVPLAVGLVVFLLAMVVSGPDVLWEATRSATPILLACSAGAFVLTNAIVRDDDSEMTGNRVLRVTALVLALTMLPLTFFAAVSMGTRVDAYGLSPERLWALVAIAVATSYGLAYFVAVVRGRLGGWRNLLRRANFNLAAGQSVVALFLALPILDFGAISASNQLGRLERGTVKPEDFDFDALKWDFGDSGTKALARLAASANAGIAKLAKEAQARTERPYRWLDEDDTRDERLANITFQFEDAELREEVSQLVRDDRGRCYSPCIVLDLGSTDDGLTHLAVVEAGNVHHLKRDENGKLQSNYDVPPPIVVATPPSAGQEPSDVMTPLPGKGGAQQVEVRPFNGRQIYVEGKPVGEPFE